MESETNVKAIRVEFTLTFNDQAEAYYKAYPEILREAIIQELTDMGGELKVSDFKLREIR